MLNSGGTQKASISVEQLGSYSLHYSMAFIFLYFGGMKFTAYEAESIAGLVANSPLLSWTYEILSQRGVAGFIGVIELSIAVLIALGPINPRLSLAGGALAIGVFATTFSFLLSTPGVIESSLGFPAITVMPGQFLLKDIVCIAVSVFIVTDSLRRLKNT